MSSCTVAEHQDEKIEAVIGIEALLSEMGDDTRVLGIKLSVCLSVDNWINEVVDSSEERGDVKLYRVTVDVDNSEL
jgi:hypothetical protein